MSRVLLAVLLITCVSVVLADSGADSDANSGADFLQSVIRRMQDKYISSGEDLGDYRPTPVPHDEHDMPPLSKGELLALYQAAVTKGSGLDLSALPMLPLSGDNTDHHNQQHDDLVRPSDQGTLPGYYYYFYPIKSFLPNSSHSDMIMMNASGHEMMMMDDNAITDDMKETRIDPLFLALAGFVSMATIVSFSILFLPKFGEDRAGQKASLKHLPEDEGNMFSLTRVVGQAIQGKDCADRLACELGKAIRKMDLGQNPIRVLEAVLPPHLSRQMSLVRQHMVKRNKCHIIPCKPLKLTKKQKSNNKKQSKH